MELGRIITLNKIADPRGNLSVAEQLKDVPFRVSRVYWTYDIPAGSLRGGHAHRHCREFIIAVNGSFCVTLDDGSQRQPYQLNRPYLGLLVDTGIWRTLDDFSAGSVCLVLAEDPYDEADYIYDYEEFMQSKKKDV